MYGLLGVRIADRKLVFEYLSLGSLLERTCAVIGGPSADVMPVTTPDGSFARFSEVHRARGKWNQKERKFPILYPGALI